MTKSAKASGRYIFVGSILSKVISLGSSILLARLLVPEDYGYWVIVNVVTTFFALVVDIGFEYYYVITIQPDTSSEERARLENTIFVLRALTNVVLFLFQIVVSYLLVGIYYNEPVDALLRILAFIYLASIFGKINEVRLKKALDFRIITISKITGELISAVAKVAMAWGGLGVFSFAYGALLNGVVYSGVLSMQGKFIPNLKLFSKEKLSGILTYAKHSWLGGLGLFFSQQADKMLLKIFYPISSLGFYSFSNSYALVIFNSVLMPQNTLFMTYISNNGNRKDVLVKSFTDIFKIIIFAIVPLQLPILFFPQEFIVLMFGDKWKSASGLLIIFLIGILAKSIVFPLMSGLTAMGKVQANTRVVLVKAAVVTLLLLSVGLSGGGIELYGVIFVLCEIVFDNVKLMLFTRYMGISILDFEVANLRTLSILVVSAAALLVMKLLMNGGLATFIVASSVYFLLYLFLVFLFNKELFVIIKRFIR